MGVDGIGWGTAVALALDVSVESFGEGQLESCYLLHPSWVIYLAGDAIGSSP
jgi:hypothetical protein